MKNSFLIMVFLTLFAVPAFAQQGDNLIGTRERAFNDGNVRTIYQLQQKLEALRHDFVQTASTISGFYCRGKSIKAVKARLGTLAP